MKKIMVGIFALVLLFSTSFAIVGTERTIKVNKLVADEIEERGEVDYFNFYISEAGSVQIEVDFDVMMDYMVKLIDKSTGKIIQNTRFDSQVNTTSGRVLKITNKVRLPEGSYEIQVSSSTVSYESYELKVVYSEENSDKYEKESNNEPKTAMIIDYNRRITGNLESNNDVDYYMVEIPYNGEIYTELLFDKNAAYNVDIFGEVNGSLRALKYQRYEAKLNQYDDTYFASSEMIRIPKGNYYFKVSRAGSNFSDKDYGLAVKYVHNLYGNYEIEDNNEAKNATKIDENTEFSGNLNANNDVDFYRVALWNANKFTVKMNVPEGASYYVTAYKEVNGALSQISSEIFGDTKISGVFVGKEMEISQGTYYFKVNARTYSNSDYKFLVETNNMYNNSYSSTIVLEINNPYMLVNNVTYEIDENRGTAPIILNGRTMLPIRAIIEKLGGTATWIDGARGIDINLGGNNVYLTLDNTLAYVNGVAKYLDVAPTSINGRTMLPVKFVIDNLGGNVVWDANTSKVTITY